MTAPGSVPPPAPGWWVKRNRVVFPTPAALTLTGFPPIIGRTLAPAAAALTLTGFAPTVIPGQVVTPTAGTLTLTGYAPTVTIAPSVPLSIIGTPAAVRGSSITLPTHAVGDLIVVFAYNETSNTVPSKPAASGTVPAWNDIDANTGANSCSSRSAYFVATATNHTSGTWGANEMAAIVLRGQNATPIGGHAESGGSAVGQAVAPAITLSKTDGTSFILAFYAAGGGGSVDGFTNWNLAPSGYTQRATAASSGNGGVCLNTKTTTTSDGSSTQTFSNTSPASRYRGNTIEILD